jgi:uncharacterized protein YjbI with pentapeptide repeats
MPKQGKSRRRELTRSDFEVELALAKAENRVPQISGSASGLDLSDLDFTSEYESNIGPYGAVYLGIDLRHSTLRNCNLERCDISNANLRGADLSGSNLKSANLYNTLFEGATLDHADLSDSNLVSTEFSATSVNGTVLRNTRFGGTSIIDTDLSRTVELGRALHYRPSAIDTSSLRLTCNGLEGQPEYLREEFFQFLSLSGLDDELTAVVRLWTGRPVEYYSVFISHSSLDKEFARKLYRDLQDLGIKCWLDEREILPGDSILDSVDKGIKVHDRMILVCSKNSLGPTTGWWVEEELARALAKERELRRAGHRFGVIVPITLDSFVFTEWQSGYRETILEKKVGDFSNEETQAYARSLEELVRALNRDRQA